MFLNALAAVILDDLGKGRKGEREQSEADHTLDFRFPRER
jgi:hypothetical protein